MTTKLIAKVTREERLEIHPEILQKLQPLTGSIPFWKLYAWSTSKFNTSGSC
jgi:hypothetical protein